jgi:hypothetical protein
MAAAVSRFNVSLRGYGYRDGSNREMRFYSAPHIGGFSTPQHGVGTLLRVNVHISHGPTTQ